MSKLLLPRGYRNAELLHNRLHKKPESYWIQRGEIMALRLFHEMAARIPAYRDFLSKNGINSRNIKTLEDFKKVPVIDKDNYLRKYPKDQLCWDGDFGHGRWTVSTTSGSTGKPYYFPRETSQDWQYAVMAELYLRNNFSIQDKTTLYVVAFPMGAWIGGLFTYEALRIIADHGGYDLSIITPGINKQEVINAIKELGDSYDQVIIGAYAPFLKDILDDGKREGLNWESYNLGFVFSAEAFSENFRNYVIKTTGAEDINKFSLNHYGTVDQGTLAHETPASVFIRRKLVERDQLDLLFPEKHRQPTLAQYNPEMFYFEQDTNNLLCSSYSGIPLVRYNLNDYGGIIPKEAVYAQLGEKGIDLKEELIQAGLNDNVWNLPFLYVYERNDFSVSYYSFLVYPDTIRRALHQQAIEDGVTGKFNMRADYDETGRQLLIINIEAKHGVNKDDGLVSKLKNVIHDNLLKESSEYNETYKQIGEVVKPIIKLWNYEDRLYFKAGAKQKWVEK